MSGKSQLIGAAGVGLIGANFWTGPQRSQLSAGFFSKGATAADTAAAQAVLKQLGAEALFVGVATLIGSTGDSGGNAMLAVIVALGIVWAITHYASGVKFTTPGGSIGGIAGTKFNIPTAE